MSYLSWVAVCQSFWCVITYISLFEEYHWGKRLMVRFSGCVSGWTKSIEGLLSEHPLGKKYKTEEEVSYLVMIANRSIEVRTRTDLQYKKKYWNHSRPMQDKMNGMKTTKSEQFNGQRDKLKMNRWLCKIDVYFDIWLVDNTQLQLNIQTKMNFVSTLLTGTVSNWWFMKLIVKLLSSRRKISMMIWNRVHSFWSYPNTER